MRFIDELEIIGRLFSESTSDKDKEGLRFASDAIRFILNTGQTEEFESYIQSLNAFAPPLIIARFKTRAEAEAGMNARVPPVRQAHVLIGDDYYSAMFVPATGRTHLVFMPPILEHYLQEVADQRPTPSGLSFATKAEAEAWMNQQPTPPQQVVIDIAGAPYLAAYHHRIDYRVLYPLPSPTPPSPET
ncbi:head protein [Corallococcus macrosporus]|uniref:Head protein n=1 Tax=Corallococcus macrosporus TaxID=35 RepID=A0ABS3DHZ4_9BACT|nr:head protein [Corallococcus macrosporus]MBN8230962.1 head protein [Corallococcus macrosporus]